MDVVNEARPAVQALICAIAHQPGGRYPVGHIECWLTVPDDMMECRGQRVAVQDFPDLYAAIGDRFCPPQVVDPYPTRLQRILRALGVPVRVRARVIDNPDYVPGHFRLPDFRSQLVMEPWPV